ncbi:MAG: DUF6320 domain-containing protein [bacterium]|nr:DUF6320 domain-containing protein [bacterium]
MSQCKQCNVIVMDDTEKCPLCNCVLERTEPVVNKYPDIWAKNHVLKLLIRIYAFLAIVLEGFLIFANIVRFNGIWWCVITGIAFAYVYLTLAYTVDNSRAGYRAKMVVGVAGGILMLAVIDKVLGYRGWSLNYVFPALLIALDFTILLLIAINRRNWQSYLMFQLMMIIFSLIPVLLNFTTNLVDTLTVAYVALAISVACFLGTLIIGGNRATTELKRRFHIR